jgi:hypothetical protein
MKRSIFNSVFFTLLYGAPPLQIISLVYEQWTIWLLLCLPIVFVFIRTQHYVYHKNGRAYFRRMPFFRGVPLENIRHVSDLKLIDTTKNIKKIWLLIEHKRFI